MVGRTYLGGRGLAPRSVLAAAVAGGLMACGGPSLDPELGRLEAACDRDPQSCLEASRRYAADGSDEARRRRGEVLARGCDQGEGAACDELALAFLAEEVPVVLASCRDAADPAACAAGATHRSACEAGRGGSCAALAELARAGRLSAEVGQIEAAGCEAGHGPSCYRRGLARRPTEESTEAFRRGCELDHGPSCLELARNQARGWGHPIDLERARLTWDRACTLKSGEGCYLLARAYEIGVGGGVSLYEARTTYRTACSLDDADACEAFARMVEAGRGGKRQPPLAYDFFRRAVKLREVACDAGDGEACVGWSRLLVEGSGTTQDRARAEDLQRHACAEGIAAGCVEIGRRRSGFDGAAIDGAARVALAARCANGAGDACVLVAALGEQVDLGESCDRGHGASCTALALGRPLRAAGARALLERACDLGDPGGCHHLGLALELPGVDQEVEAAVAAHRRGCRWGDGAACRSVGILLLRGEGLRLAPLEAASAFEAGCEIGDAASCSEIGILRLEGVRVGRNPRFAIRFLERGCRLGDSAGCGRLGFALLRGKWVPRDAFRARKLLRSACEGGHPRSCLDLAEAEERGTLLPKDEVAAARHRALAAAGSQGRCEARIAVCGDGDVVRRSRWILDAGRVRREVTEPLACGAELERTCDDALRAWSERCERDGAACWSAAQFVRLMAEEGMAASQIVAEQQERDAVAWARPACRKGDAAACVVVAEAFAAGRGGLRADSDRARRSRQRVCELDPTRCEPTEEAGSARP